jgi:hypothetical protein
MEDKFPVYMWVLTLGRLEKVRNEIALYNKYCMPISERDEMVNHLDHAINILKWNIEDERKNYDNK